jgi:ferredoxin-type protein NapH
MKKPFATRQSFLDSFFKYREDANGNVLPKRRLSFRAFRFATAIACAALFIISFRADIQILEGTLTGSRFIGFHLIDPFETLEVVLAHKTLPVNLLIGAATIVIAYLVLGGRCFCSWVCPFGLLSECGEKIHLTLQDKGWIKKRRRLPLKIKYFIWAFFLALAAIEGILVFDFINVAGILSRCLIYGVSLSALFVVFALAIEIFFSRRVWCRSICPIGATYGLLNPVALIKIHVASEKCTHCGNCVSACHVPEVLAPVYMKKKKIEWLLSTDCTMCGRCADVCPDGVFTFENRLKKLI